MMPELWQLLLMAVLVLAMGWYPCCCGVECDIQSGFVSGEWAGGGWTFSTTTATGGGYGDTSGTSSTAAASAVATMDAIDVGEKVRVCVHATDADNYLAGEVERTSGGYTLRLISRSSGSDTIVTSTSSLVTPVGALLYVCHDGSDLMARVGTALSVPQLRATVTALSGRKAAIWSDGSITLSGFAFSNIGDNCEPCVGRSCDKCTGTAPVTMIVTLSGAANNVCGSCSSIDGTYVCVGAESGSPTPDSCQWSYSLSGACTLNKVTFKVFRTSDGLGGFNFHRQAEFRFGILSGTFITITSGHPSGYAIDCLTISESLGYGSSGSTQCDLSGATCTVSSP